MGAWGYGILQNDAAQDSMCEVARRIESDIASLSDSGSEKNAASLGAATGLLLQFSPLCPIFPAKQTSWAHSLFCSFFPRDASIQPSSGSGAIGFTKSGRTSSPPTMKQNRSLKRNTTATWSSPSGAALTGFPRHDTRLPEE
jgi:hypothetical protein